MYNSPIVFENAVTTSQHNAYQLVKFISKLWPLTMEHSSAKLSALNHWGNDY